MPTSCSGAERVLPVTGRKVCTIADFTKHDTMNLGPDGARWELFSHDEVVLMLANPKFSCTHNAVAAIHHVCCIQSKWAFQIPGPAALLPQAVCFFYIKPPSALAMMAGGGGVTYKFDGVLIKRGYDMAREAWGSYIWRRIHVNGAIEIATNFCVR